MTSQCTEQAVREYVKDRGGRVPRMELIDHFLSDCGDETASSEVGERREMVRRIVDTVGLVKVEDGVKFVCLNSENSNGEVVRSGSDAHGQPHSECNGNIHFVNGNPDNEQQTGESSPPADPLDNDKEANGNKQQPATPSQNNRHGTTTLGGGGGAGEVRLRDRRRRESAPIIGASELDQVHAAAAHSQQLRALRRVSKGSQRAILTSCLSEDSTLEGLETIGDIHTPKGSRRNFIELMMSSSPQVRRSLINRGSRLRDSMRSDGDSTSILSNTDEECTAVTLDPLEHEWMLCASDSLWESLQPLLAVEPSLVAKKDFVTGFTCLHWAAKQGKAELISQLLTFAKDNSISVNVNVRSSAGYTPLHLAAMHGHVQVVRVLLSDWEADPEARDYSGRRAIQYLPPPLVAGLHEEGVVTSPSTESDSENTNSSTTWGRWRLPKVLQGNLNPLRLLNPPAEAAEDGNGSGKNKGGIQRKSSLSRLNARLHRGRHRAQIIHSASFRDASDVGKSEELPKSPMRTRPLSNMFG